MGCIQTELFKSKSYIKGLHEGIYLEMGYVLPYLNFPYSLFIFFILHAHYLNQALGF